jgi:acetyl esterase/lipase
MATQTLNSFLYGCDAPYPPSASALNLITPTYPPTYVLAAMADELIPKEHSLLLYDKLQEHGVESHIVKVDGAGHGYVERPPTDWPAGTDYWKDAIREAVDWAVAKVK